MDNSDLYKLVLQKYIDDKTSSFNNSFLDIWCDRNLRPYLFKNNTKFSFDYEKGIQISPLTIERKITDLINFLYHHFQNNTTLIGSVETCFEKAEHYHKENLKNNLIEQVNTSDAELLYNDDELILVRLKTYEAVDKELKTLKSTLKYDVLHKNIFVISIRDKKNKPFGVALVQTYKNISCANITQIKGSLNNSLNKRKQDQVTNIIKNKIFTSLTFTNRKMKFMVKPTLNEKAAT